MKTKLAWIRDPDVPQGQPALGTFTCPCGEKIGPVPFAGVGAVLGMEPVTNDTIYTCSCGLSWDGRGWLVSES